MIKKISMFFLAGTLGLGAKIWVNAIRDPGAELGQGDWTTDSMGISDSARVNAHDPERSFTGSYSFLTDTKTYCGVVDGGVRVWCGQNLSVPKAVSDIDSCIWMYNLAHGHEDSIANAYISFHSTSFKTIIWEVGHVDNSYPPGETAYVIAVPFPNIGEWSRVENILSQRWTEHGWSGEDTIYRVQLNSIGQAFGNRWYGQEVSWDDVFLRSVAYYDYAAKSIDSDPPDAGKYTPKVTFANEGIKDDKQGWVCAEILYGMQRVYADSQKVSIPKESSLQVTFKEWSVPDSGVYVVRAYTRLEPDELAEDDALIEPLTGIAEPSSPETPVTPFSFELDQAIIRFAVPYSTNVSLKVYDIT
ncbi:hypothetical protein GX441_02795, partial [bacterium]|nr:hypothetical protein [bacterium]